MSSPVLCVVFLVSRAAAASFQQRELVTVADAHLAALEGVRDQRLRGFGGVSLALMIGLDAIGDRGPLKPHVPMASRVMRWTMAKPSTQ
jgi:hypothetical protein